MHHRQLERNRLAMVLLTIVMSIAGVTLFALIPHYSDWRTGLMLNIAENTVLIIYALRTRDSLLLHFMLFGVCAGIVELAADAWLVDVTGTLSYAIGDSPMIWRSPLWMPLAWEMVAVQFGYLGVRLMEWRRGWGLLLIGLLGAINIPFYEEMALRIHWWEYSNARMLSHTPYYIILGEFLIAMCFAVTALPLRSQQLRKTIEMGCIGGLLIFPCYVIGYWVTEKLL